jgi:hypothetical protein
MQQTRTLVGEEGGPSPKLRGFRCGTSRCPSKNPRGLFAKAKGRSPQGMPQEQAISSAPLGIEITRSCNRQPNSASDLLFPAERKYFNSIKKLLQERKKPSMGSDKKCWADADRGSSNLACVACCATRPGGARLQGSVIPGGLKPRRCTPKPPAVARTTKGTGPASGSALPLCACYRRRVVRSACR